MTRNRTSNTGHTLRLWVPKVVSVARPTWLLWLRLSSAPPRTFTRNPAQTYGRLGPRVCSGRWRRASVPRSASSVPVPVSARLCSCKLRPRRAVRSGSAGWPWSACLPVAGASTGGRGWSSSMGCSGSSGYRKLPEGQRPRLGLQLGCVSHVLHRRPCPVLRSHPTAPRPAYTHPSPSIATYQAPGRGCGAAGLREVLGDLNRSPCACLPMPVPSGQHTGCDSHVQGTRGCWDGPRLSTVVVIVPGPHCAVYLLMKAPRGSPVIIRDVCKETGSVNKPMAASWALPGFLGPPGKSARSLDFRLGGG